MGLDVGLVYIARERDSQSELLHAIILSHEDFK